MWLTVNAAKVMQNQVHQLQNLHDRHDQAQEKHTRSVTTEIQWKQNVAHIHVLTHTSGVCLRMLADATHRYKVFTKHPTDYLSNSTKCNTITKAF